MNTQAYVITCPHCGTLKMVVCPTNDWIDTDYILWSDGYLESKQWKGPAYTQKCNSCGKFFTLPRRNTLKVTEKEYYETGQLPLQTLKQAIAELAGDEVAEPRARLEAWWVFNALYKDTDDIPAEELAYYKDNMQWLIDFHTPRVTRFSHLLFELHRLLGHKDVCEQMIESLTYDEYVRQRKTYCTENKMKFYDDEMMLKHRYQKEIEDFRFALTQPLKSYVKDVVKTFEE